MNREQHQIADGMAEFGQFRAIIVARSCNHTYVSKVVASRVVTQAPIRQMRCIHCDELEPRARTVKEVLSETSGEPREYKREDYDDS